ncbi:MAG TPA: tetratricopeptide repeat protein [Acidimicrobiales bacterium]|nr:tetratricopeptide repeat protein [Acidimicrobiales bacterium]
MPPASPFAEIGSVTAPGEGVGSRGTSTVRRPSAASDTVSTGTTGSGRYHASLGAGLVDVPAVAPREPQEAVLDNPEVPERKRFCGRCDHPVGRARGPRAAGTEGFCPHCGAPYSFRPKLWPGDLVGGQYLVAGCIAHGGLGWVYLAQDKNVEDSWVVLKGLLDSGGESAMAAAAAEKRFLAEVRHPNIVRIYNFVQHDGAGYIVMEYVGGQSLREVRVRHRDDTGEPLPVAQSIAYILGILPALGYLHRRGLLYCDFKPDNVIQAEEQLTLIDLGGVRRMGDHETDLYGTIGYQAPEVSEHGASVASDLYTVARMLAVLSIEFPGFQDEKRYATRLPPVHEVPAFQRYESFYRFLEKATATDPAARFESAGEMAEQLLGVLRQVVATDGGSPAPVPSAHFSAELGAGPDAYPWQFLPVPTVDPADPAAGVLATVALLGPDQRQALLGSTARSPELSLGMVRVALDGGDVESARHELDSPEARNGGWRAAWWHGVVQLAERRPSDALAYFAAVAGELPGELAPKLALATCHEDEAAARADNGDEQEAARSWRDAAGFYAVVAGTDPTFVGAHFGLARVFSALGDRDGAITALERVPKSSSAYVAAQTALCAVRCSELHGAAPDLEDLVEASRALDALTLESSVRLPLVRDLHLRALGLLLDGRVVPDDAVLVGGAELNEDGQRSSLERTYRALARLAHSDAERYALVDEANACRPRTLT